MNDKRLKRIWTGTEGSPASLQYLVHTYDDIGNIASLTDNRASETLNFAYDHLDRMIEVTGAITRTYAYDEIGNITDFNGTSYNYGDEDHVHAVTSAGSGTYSYDANGNMTLRATGGVTQTLTYDYENRLTEVDNGTNTVTFEYDGNGQRVKKVENGVTTLYIGNYYEVYDPGGANEEVTKYYYASGKRIAMREGDALYWIHGDHLGSTVLVTDDQAPGEEVGRQKYYPYGSDRGQSGSIPTDYLFTGQKWDNPIGLYFYNARYYDPSIGGFIQADTIVPDPMNPQQYNRYSYVLNNPLRYIDPSGHQCIDFEGYCMTLDELMQYLTWPEDLEEPPEWWWQGMLDMPTKYHGPLFEEFKEVLGHFPQFFPEEALGDVRLEYGTKVADFVIRAAQWLGGWKEPPPAVYFEGTVYFGKPPDPRDPKDIGLVSEEMTHYKQHRMVGAAGRGKVSFWTLYIADYLSKGTTLEDLTVTTDVFGRLTPCVYPQVDFNQRNAYDYNIFEVQAQHVQDQIRAFFRR